MRTEEEIREEIADMKLLIEQSDIGDMDAFKLKHQVVFGEWVLEEDE